MRRGLLIVVAVAAVGLLWPAAPPAEAGQPGKSLRPAARTCGILPGDGAYNYIKTRGIRCAPAKRVAFRAHRRFCKRRGGCLIQPPLPITTVYKGRTRFHGWGCRIKDGWELLVVRCSKREMQLFYKTAA